MQKTLSLFLAVILLIFSVPLSGLSEEQVTVGESGIQTLGRELIVTGSLVWQVVDQTLLCTEIPSGKTMASLPLIPAAFLSSPGEGELYRVSLLSGPDDSVLVCGAFLTEDAGLSVLLAEFVLDASGRVVMRSVKDLSDTLGAFYEPDSGCLQVDMVSCGGDLFLTVLDEDFNCHLCSVDLNTGSVSDFGELPYAMLTAALSWEDRLLLAGDSLSDDSGLSLSLLSVPDGDLVPLAEIPTGSSASGQNFAYDAETNRLFFTLRNTAYRVEPKNGSTPEPIAVFSTEPASFGKGAMACGKYIVQSEDGELLSCDAQAVLSADPVRIVNCTENTFLEETTARFNSIQADCFLTVESPDSALSLREKTELLRSCDAVMLSLSSAEYRELIRQDFCADLSGSRILQAAVSEMDDPVYNALYSGGSLTAFPVSLETPCLTLHTAAAAALTGLAPEELPKDWNGLLSMLADISEGNRFASHPEYTVTFPGISADEFRQIMLIYLLRSVLLEASLYSDSSAPFDALPSLLDAFDRVDWARLEPRDSSGMNSEEAIPMIGEEFFEITTAYRDPDIFFWPLAVISGREPIIPCQVSVLVLNSQSSHQETLLHWAEFLWEQSDISFRMCLCPGMNDPVPNVEYQATVAELGDILRSYEAMAAETTDPEEADMIRAEAEELRNYLESYRAEAMWYISEESLATYRNQTFAPDPCAFWETEEGLQMIDSYLAGDVSGTELISRVRLLLQEP